MIVVNDGSTDATGRILRGFGGRIKCIDQPNRGVSAARNAAVDHARDLISRFLDFDDLWPRDKLARMMPALQARPDAVLAYSNFVHMDGEGNRGKTFHCGGPPSMDDLLRGGWTILPSAVVMPRSIYGRCGGFCEEFKGPGGDDPFMWLMARAVCLRTRAADALPRNA
ncbi:MAG: glycosyltransferase family 2 protein, partial [Acidobacteriota bacterium]|nr:glycosyltransferase family 2 protein [Acidobacteriota bacterium]